MVTAGLAGFAAVDSLVCFLAVDVGSATAILVGT